MRRVEVSVTATVKSPRDRCFEYVMPIRLSRIFRPYLFLPGVRRTNETAHWSAAGLCRTVYFTDGSTAQETLLDVRPPHSFSYHIADFTGTNRLLLNGIDGAWDFSACDIDSTHIHWTYTLNCRERAAEVVARAVLKPVLRAYLKRALATIQYDLEGEDDCSAP